MHTIWFRIWTQFKMKLIKTQKFHVTEEKSACDDKKIIQCEKNWSISSEEPKVWSANWFSYMEYFMMANIAANHSGFLFTLLVIKHTLYSTKWILATNLSFVTLSLKRIFFYAKHSVRMTIKRIELEELLGLFAWAHQKIKREVSLVGDVMWIPSAEIFRTNDRQIQSERFNSHMRSMCVHL